MKYCYLFYLCRVYTSLAGFLPVLSSLCIEGPCWKTLLSLTDRLGRNKQRTDSDPTWNKQRDLLPRVEDRLPKGKGLEECERPKSQEIHGPHIHIYILNNYIHIYCLFIFTSDPFPIYFLQSAVFLSAKGETFAPLQRPWQPETSPLPWDRLWLAKRCVATQLHRSWSYMKQKKNYGLLQFGCLWLQYGSFTSQFSVYWRKKTKKQLYMAFAICPLELSGFVSLISFEHRSKLG